MNTEPRPLTSRPARIALAGLAGALCFAAGLLASTRDGATVALVSAQPPVPGVADLAGTTRVKYFYDPTDADDLYVNRRGEEQLATLRSYGLATVCDPMDPGQGNRPATAGSDVLVDPNTGLVPEDPAYTDPEGPFSPLSEEAPEVDYTTWNPAWISERLDDARGLAGWDCAMGIDEVSRGSAIRYDGRNGSQKVWLRHWYEPTHLDKDLNADDCLTDQRGFAARDDGDDDVPDGPDGWPDAPMNPAATNLDEWYPAIMTELTYMLMENELPEAMPEPEDLQDSAPRPACGTAGRTRIVFPTGVEEAALDPDAPPVGYGLTSLDADFDGTIDMINVGSEETVSAELGLDLDFDGDGAIEPLDPDGTPLTCDELTVLHTDAIRIGAGEKIQLLDHYVELRTVSDNSVVLRVWYTGDLVPRSPGKSATVGIGGAAFASDSGPLQVIPPEGGNLGVVPVGPWFAYVQDVDVRDGTATLIVGRGLGAPCASMEAAPNVPNLSPGGPWFLKRIYVDGHEYNVVAIMTCGTNGFQYLTLRAPLPKTQVVIEQHSVRLRAYLPGESLALPPPFNHEHTVLEDVVALAPFDPCPLLPEEDDDEEPRPEILYMGGPIGPLPPILGDGDGLLYEGRDPARPVGPYDLDAGYLQSHWFYTAEDLERGFVGELREKYGALRSDLGTACPITEPVPDSFFFNEQMLTQPWHYTEFFLPDREAPGGDAAACDPDSYYATSAFINPTARWRRWTMPDEGVPDEMPPLPPDLSIDATGYDPDTLSYGAPRRASFRFDPDEPRELFLGPDGVRLYGGLPDCEDADCQDAASRPSTLTGAGDVLAAFDPLSGAPVEVLPYTDPFAPFNPQHPDAPRGDSLTFDPAYMDEFRNFNEPLRYLYRQLSVNGLNAREKVYHRIWYRPDYLTKIRHVDDCDRDLTFPAIEQEYTFLSMDTTDNPVALPPGTSRLAFPISARADELPMPNVGGTLPPGGGFGHGLTTFDGTFDGLPEAVSVHTEQTINALFDQLWQANRPSLPGIPPSPLPGPVVDFDGDGVLDDLDEDCISLNGNELVVFSLESITLDRDPDTPEPDGAMLLDYLVKLENVTPGQSVDMRFWFTGGNAADARPEPVRGRQTMGIGHAAVVDRFQDRVSIIEPGEDNLGLVDGAWFAYVEDVAADAERVTIVIGRALGASHSAIDDGAGAHDLAPGDPWYLKRFYVDGHEYNVAALMTRTIAGLDPQVPAVCNEGLAFITIRTPVPKGNFFNPQDSLFQQGYFLDGLPPEMSVLPPFNMEHTVARDIHRIDPQTFQDIDDYGPCIGPIAPAPPLVERIVEETLEPRFGVELRETYNQPTALNLVGDDAVDALAGDPARIQDVVTQDDTRSLLGWETHQSAITPATYTTVQVPEGPQYLLTLNWRTPYTWLDFYGCTRAVPGPFSDDEPPELTQQGIYEAALCWRDGVVPAPVDYLWPYEGPPADGDWERRLGWTGGETPAPPTLTPVPMPTAAPSATPTPTPPPTGAAELLVDFLEDLRMRIRWPAPDADALAAETTGYRILVAADDGPLVEVARVDAGAGALAQQGYEHVTSPASAGTRYTVQVLALDDSGGETPLAESPPSEVAPARPPEEMACVEGRADLQGRVAADGTQLFVDELPVGGTREDGLFRHCGIRPGERALRATRGFYLPSAAMLALRPGETEELPDHTLTGGDTNEDGRIDLFDLVRVGASYDTTPPLYTNADLNEDGTVNLFDLVLVSGNYDKVGAQPWWPGASLPAEAAARVSAPSRARDAVPAARGDALRLVARPLGAGRYALELRTRGVAEVFGADVVLAFDPARVRVLDAVPERPGGQIEAGEAWGDGHVAIEALGRERARLAATRLSGTGPLPEDALLATLLVETEGDPLEAVRLEGHRMLDAGGRLLAGDEALDVTVRAFGVYLPSAIR